MAKRAVNITRNVEVASHVRLCNNPWSRFWGLMNKPGLPEGHGIWIVPCSQIHSCFMRFRFDAIFMDKQGTVLHLEEKMKPWGLSKMIWKARAVLELDGGVIAKTGTGVGDVIELRDE